MADPVSTLLIVLAVVLGVLLLWGPYDSLGRRYGASKSGARLPKGSFGWPLIGETLEFFRDPGKFSSSHVKRYGSIFQTSVFTQRVTMGTTPEFAKFVLTSKVCISSQGMPKSFSRLLGSKAVMFKDGPEHLSIKKLLQKPILPEGLRKQVNVVEAIISENLASWEQRGTIVSTEGAKKISFDIAMWFSLGVRHISSTPQGRKARDCFQCLRNGLGSIPVNLPGTNYSKALKARAALKDYIKYLVELRKGQENTQADTLAVLLAAREDPEAREEVKDLDDDTLVDNLLFMWFAASDTSSTTLAWTVKLLIENPVVFRRIQAEQQEILQSKGPLTEGPRLSWEDTRKMVYSQKFFKETQRFLAISPGAMRYTTQDLEFDGYFIPKDTGVRPLYNLIHSDPAIYPNPERFDPDRFDTTPKPYTYLPFSSGVHMCPGIEVAQLNVLILVHYLTTSYEYESAAPDRGMTYTGAMPAIIGGYPINIRRQS